MRLQMAGGALLFGKVLPCLTPELKLQQAVGNAVVIWSISCLMPRTVWYWCRLSEVEQLMG